MQQLRLKGAEPQRAKATAPQAASEWQPQARKPLRCVRCGAVATWDDLRIEVDGSHEHARTNPAGVAFLFGCFQDAEGCIVSDVPTTADSWFKGCAWQYAHCRGCSAHLGWYFSGATAFFGLVLDRLSTGDHA